MKTDLKLSNIPQVVISLRRGIDLERLISLRKLDEMNCDVYVSGQPDQILQIGKLLDINLYSLDKLPKGKHVDLLILDEEYKDESFKLLDLSDVETIVVGYIHFSRYEQDVHDLLFTTCLEGYDHEHLIVLGDTQSTVGDCVANMKHLLDCSTRFLVKTFADLSKHSDSVSKDMDKLFGCDTGSSARGDFAHFLSQYRSSDSPEPEPRPDACWDCEHNRLNTCPIAYVLIPNSNGSGHCLHRDTNPHVEYGDSPRKGRALKAFLKKKEGE